MTLQTFARAIECMERLETLAMFRGAPRLVLLSGGECTEWPLLVEAIAFVRDRGIIPVLISNGLWLGPDASGNDPIEAMRLRAAILGTDQIFVQVTYDPRFYRREPPRIDDPRVSYVNALNHITPLGRVVRSGRIDARGLPLRMGPTSFNLRSITRATGSIAETIAMLRLRALEGHPGHCIPSITHEGYVLAGETRSCYQIGTVDSSNDDLTRAVLAMGSCNRCGLEDHLNAEQRQAIGLLTVPTYSFTMLASELASDPKEPETP